MFWSRRNKKRIDLAAHVTDAANPAALERALTSDPDLQTEAEDLARLLRAIPKTQPVLEIDLLPLVKARLAAESVSQPVRAWRPMLKWAPVGALCAAALAVVLGLSLKPAAPMGGAVATMETAGQTPVELALADVRSLLERREMGPAYERAMAVVNDHPTDPRSGEAAMIAADLAFDMQRYDDAYAIYTKVRADYTPVLDAHPDWEKRVANRRDVLAEAKKTSYDSLYAFELAKRNRSNPIGGFEEVIAKYPDTLVASLATESIGLAILEEQGLDPNKPEDRVLAMKSARDRCTNPVAVASLELEIGLAYINDFQDATAAKAHITTASENPMLVQRVQSAMARLQSTAR
ncbi:MAG: hypothetical protein AMXMBFR84_38760 [Candidatus Hydrogenedentota bacterium]